MSIRSAASKAGDIGRWAGSAVTAAALVPVGLPLVNPFPANGAVHRARLRVLPDADVPRGVRVLEPGVEREAVVRASTAALPTARPAVHTLSIKVRDAYGDGRDQDFLLASSGDGVPLHHLLLPARSAGESLYSSLWLYLAGRRPVLFGARLAQSSASPKSADLRAGTRMEFLMAGPLGRFRPIGQLTLGDPLSEAAADGIDFDAAHVGGGLRALPPTGFYHQRAA